MRAAGAEGLTRRATRSRSESGVRTLTGPTKTPLPSGSKQVELAAVPVQERANRSTDGGTTRIVLRIAQIQRSIRQVIWYTHWGLALRK